MVDANGVDVNVADAWAGTMMANSARDPFWRAKVSHEVLVNPAHQSALELTCTKCHAPQGRYNAEHLGLTYSIAMMQSDSVGLEGVACGACHQRRDTALNASFSGNLFFDTLKNVFGPYTNPMGPMAGNSGFTPLYGAHINNAGLCGSCHTLITETADLSGNLTGNHFVEQATYHEWLNSEFNTETNVNGRTCQSCHIPRIDDAVRLSNGPPFGLYRSPFGKHELVGGNVFMLKLLKANISGLGLYATAVNFDSTIARTERMLKQQTLDLTLVSSVQTADSLFYDVRLSNKAGHKFPSGYPSRRAYVEFVVMDDNGDTLFKSGIRQGDDLQNQNTDYEPHYNIINSDQQVQIYEMVMADVNGDITTVLERANTTIKDNRLVPSGFTAAHNAYDTCKVYGDALTDSDFNFSGSTEGTGTDDVHFRIDLGGYTGNLNISTRVYYESVPRKWLDEMFTFSSVEIDLFESLYNAADRSPVLVAELLDGSIFQSVPDFNFPEFSVYPNPSADGHFQLINLHEDILQTEVYDLQGKLIQTGGALLRTSTLYLNIPPGVYFVKVYTKSGSATRKLVISA
jgi:hypothetical protein